MSGYILVAGDRWQIDKDPQASLIYGVDVAEVLAPGDTLAGTPTATAGAPGGLTITQAGYTGTVVRARIAGGAAGTTVPVTFAWQTTGGDTDNRTIYLRVVER